MQKIGLVLCTLAVSGLAACAPKPKPVSHESIKEQVVADTISSTSPIARANLITQKMVQELNLTEVQRNKVALINEDFSIRYNILVASTNPKINKRDEFIKLTNEKNAELRKVLNNAQVTKWDGIRAAFWEEYRIM